LCTSLVQAPPPMANGERAADIALASLRGANLEVFSPRAI
jgi:hypothetical protein